MQRSHRPSCAKYSRYVDMSNQLAKVLFEMKRKGDEWQLQTSDGTMLDPSNLRKSFQKFLEDAELRRIRFHDLRHTFATLQIKNNQSLAYIRDQLGHSSIKVTVDLYGHIKPGDFESAADLLDDGTSAGTSGNENEDK
jgi:integrase